MGTRELRRCPRCSFIRGVGDADVVLFTTSKSRCLQRGIKGAGEASVTALAMRQCLFLDSRLWRCWRPGNDGVGDAEATEVATRESLRWICDGAGFGEKEEVLIATRRWNCYLGGTGGVGDTGDVALNKGHS